MIPDNYDMWESHDRKQERRRSDLPVCDYCGEPIQEEHFFYINGECFCEDCLNNNFRKNTDDYLDF